MYQFLLFLHVLAAATWVGAAVREVVQSPMMKANPAARVLWHRGVVALGTRLYAPAAVVVLVTGIWMVSISATIGFGAAFVSVGFLAVVVGATLGPAVYGRRYEQAAVRLEEGDLAGAEAIERSVRPFVAVELLLLVVTVAAMVWTWGV